MVPITYHKTVPQHCNFHSRLRRFIRRLCRVTTWSRSELFVYFGSKSAHRPEWAICLTNGVELGLKGKHCWNVQCLLTDQSQTQKYSVWDCLSRWYQVVASGSKLIHNVVQVCSSRQSKPQRPNFDKEWNEWEVSKIKNNLKKIMKLSEEWRRYGFGVSSCGGTDWSPSGSSWDLKHCLHDHLRLLG